MKALLLSLFSIAAAAQSMQIQDVTVTEVSGGLNLNVRTISFNGAGYIGTTQVVNGNDINVKMCFWFDLTLPVLQFQHDIFVPVSGASEYSINLEIWNSTTDETCDYFLMTDQMSLNFLGTPDIVRSQPMVLYPNPVVNVVKITGNPDAISVYDIAGKLILAERAISEFDVSALANGTYVAKIEKDATVLTKKFLVSH